MDQDWIFSEEARSLMTLDVQIRATGETLNSIQYADGIHFTIAYYNVRGKPRDEVYFEKGTFTVNGEPLLKIDKAKKLAVAGWIAVFLTAFTTGKRWIWLEDELNSGYCSNKSTIIAAALKNATQSVKEILPASHADGNVNLS